MKGQIDKGLYRIGGIYLCSPFFEIGALIAFLSWGVLEANHLGVGRFLSNDTVDYVSKS